MSLFFAILALPTIPGCWKIALALSTACTYMKAIFWGDGRFTSRPIVLIIPYRETGRRCKVKHAPRQGSLCNWRGIWHDEEQLEVITFKTLEVQLFFAVKVTACFAQHLSQGWGHHQANVGGIWARRVCWAALARNAVLGAAVAAWAHCCCSVSAKSYSSWSWGAWSLLEDS